MKSIWRGWIQTAPLSLMTLVSCLTLLTTWRIWAVLCKYDLNKKTTLYWISWSFPVKTKLNFFYTGTELTLKHTNHTTKTGLRRRYMFCCGVKHSKQQSKGITEMSCYTHFERVYCTLGQEGVWKRGWSQKFWALYRNGDILDRRHVFNLLHYD